MNKRLHRETRHPRHRCEGRDKVFKHGACSIVGNVVIGDGSVVVVLVRGGGCLREQEEE